MRQPDSAPPDIKTAIDASAQFPPFRRVPALHPLAWLKLGWQVLRAARSASRCMACGAQRWLTLCGLYYSMCLNIYRR